MIDREEYLQYLINGIEFEEDSEPEDRAMQFAVYVAAGGSTIQETMYLAYASRADLDMPNLLIYSAIAEGMSMIDVVCDCNGGQCFANILKTHPARQFGETSRDTAGVEFRDVQKKVAQITSMIYN